MSDPPLYPVALRLRDRRVLVVGGGPVAARKARRLCAAGARVTVVAPEAEPALAAAADGGELVWHRRAFEPADVEGQSLVFAATGVAAVDEAVAQATRATGGWLNAADQAVESDFHLPALLSRGALEVTVSTGGAAPGFAAALVAELGAVVGEGLADYVALLQALRDELRQRWPDDPARRQRAFGAALAVTEARSLAEAGKLAEAQQRLAEAAQGGDDHE